MTTYAIGDIHGCLRTLERLLDTLRFDDRRDRLWLTGDLVNRGPDTLGVLRWAMAHEACITAVLGNHDLHLLACAEGLRVPRAEDTLDATLEAPDRAALLHWLRRRPLLHAEGELLLVHAGLLPTWDREEACTVAKRSARLLAGPEYRTAIAAYYRAKSAPTKAAAANDLERDFDRIRRELRVFTSLRTVDSKGEPCSGFTGPPKEAPAGEYPWFSLLHRRGKNSTVVFGHWAALGLYESPGFWGLDSGCAWGRSLTAVDLDRARVIQEPCAEVEDA